MQGFDSGYQNGNVTQEILQQVSLASLVQLGFEFTPYSPSLSPFLPAACLPGAALSSTAMGKKTGRGGFGEEEVNGYQRRDSKVSWRKERSGLSEHRSDNGLERVKKKKTGNSHLLQRKRRK